MVENKTVDLTSQGTARRKESIEKLKKAYPQHSDKFLTEEEYERLSKNG